MPLRTRSPLERLPRALIATVATLGLVLSAPGSKAETPVTGVVLISIDSLRVDHTGVYGGSVATPALAAIGAEGVVVESAYTAIPATGPSHASLLTGLYPWHHGSQRNGAPLDARAPLLAQSLAEAGFTTAAFVSSDNLHRRLGFAAGFGHFEFEATEPLGLTAKRTRDLKFFARGADTASAAMAWLTQHGDAPFFVWVHFSEPHPPHVAPRGFELPPGSAVERPAVAARVPGIDFEKLDATIRAYRAEVAYVDVQLGRIVERLRLLGRLDGTALIVTGGHGEGLGERGRIRHSDALYDELVRVPFVARGPGIPAGRRLLGPAQLEDVAPTVRAWTGVAAPAKSDGFDLLPWFEGRAEKSPRTTVVGQRRDSDNGDTLYYQLRGTEKWIGAEDSPGQRFDLATDPGEHAPMPGSGMPDELRGAISKPAAASSAR